LWNDSVEDKSGAYDVSPQTVRNYIEKQGMEIIDWKMLGKLEVLKGVKEVDLSIDLQQRRGTGNR